MKALSAIFLTSVFFLILSCDSGKPVTEGYLSGADNARLYYRVMGSAQDTVVVIHGGPGAGMHSVLPSVEPLVEDFVLIFYDQRGGGLSELPDDTSKLAAEYYVEDLEAVRSHFNLEKMNVLAHSFGSILLARYAREYPDRLKRIVLHSATPPRRSEAAKYYMALAAASPEVDTSLTRKASRALQSLLNGTAENPVETCKRYEQLNDQIAIARGDSVTYQGTTCKAPPEAVRYYYQYTAQVAPQYFGAWDFSSGLESVASPVLVLHGEKDTLALSSNREWTSAYPNGKLQIIPNAGKGALSDNQGLATSVITEFFRKD